MNARTPFPGKRPLHNLTALLARAFALASLLAGLTGAAAPRRPLPPLPTPGLIYSERWDAPCRMPADPIDPSVFVESFSGYALNRTAQNPYVAPWAVPMLGADGRLNVDSRGAIRFWYRPEFDSGMDLGVPASLLTLAATNGASVAWSLVVSADGSEIDLVTESPQAVGLRAGYAGFQAGTWVLLTLGYTETNTALWLNDTLIATGDGLPAVPAELAPYSRLTIGGGPAGSGSVAAGQLDELAIFSGHNLFRAMAGHLYGLSEMWDIGLYYSNRAPVAALGPVSDAELAAQQQASAQQAAEQQSAALASPMLIGGGFGPLDATTECVTGGPVYLTNTTALLDPDNGWTVSFQLAGGTNGIPYDLMMTPVIGPDNMTNCPWSYLGQGYTCNSYAFTNQPNQAAFYIAGDATVDPDGDGLGTLFELLISHTDPTLCSTRGDGMSDRLAYLQGRNPKVPGSNPDTGGLVRLEVYTPLN